MIFFETYGCPANRADTDIMKAMLAERVCEDIGQADIIIVNSCGVKGHTERKILKRISALCDTKKVIVTGCLPKITSAIDRRASLMGINVTDITHVVREVEQGRRVEMIRDLRENKASLQRRHSLIQIIPISEGCLGSCSYCATKFARGTLQSYPASDIMRSIERAYEVGSREFHLTSQDTGCWGQDRGETLPDLLSSLESVEGDFLVRVGMMNPDSILTFLDRLVCAFDSSRTYSFLHLPVQSGSEKVLRDMGRRYTRQDVVGIVSSFRRRIPTLSFCTDVIVGFPTETEEDFSQTMSLLQALAPDKVNQTMYSARPGTRSSLMKDMPDRIKKERSRALFALRMDIAARINETYLGRRFPCFVDECGPKGTMGRLPNYKPVVVEGRLGERKMVTISRCTSTYLVAR